MSIQRTSISCNETASKHRPQRSHLLGRFAKAHSGKSLPVHEAIFFKGDSVEIYGRRGTISGESPTHWTVRIGNKEEKISKNSKVLQPITERKEMTIIQRYADFIKDQLKNEQNSSIARSNLNYDSINESVKVTKDGHHYKITKNGEHCCTIHMPPREKGYSIPYKERIIRRAANNKLNTKEINRAITQISELNEQTESMVNESDIEARKVARIGVNSARGQTGKYGSSQMGPHGAIVNAVRATAKEHGHDPNDYEIKPGQVGHNEGGVYYKDKLVHTFTHG